MIAAIAKAAFVLNNKAYRKTAKKATHLILDNMRHNHNKLYHSYIDGKITAHGNLDDYVFFIWGLLNLYKSSFKTSYLKHALTFTESMINLFWDKEGAGFYFTPQNRKELPLRQKEIRDEAYPSGNSIALYVLSLLGRITGKTSYIEKAKKMSNSFASTINLAPASSTMFMSSIDLLRKPFYEIIIVGKPTTQKTQKMLTILREHYLPNKVVLLKKSKNDLSKIAEYTESMTQEHGEPTIYFCQNYSCEEPFTEPYKLKKLLKAE